MRVSLNTSTNVYGISVPNGADYSIDGANVATLVSGTGPATLTPEYTLPTGFSNMRLWDIEQVFAGAPVNERYIPQWQRGGASDWETSILRPTLNGSPPVSPAFAGNPQPGITLGTAPGAGSANTTINNNVMYAFTLQYTPNSTPFTGGALLTSINGVPIATAANIPGRAPTDPDLFSDLVLRAAISSGSLGQRTLTLTNLQLSVDSGAPELMRVWMDGSLTSTFVATAENLPASTNLRVREYAFWDNVVSDTQPFLLTGNATWSFPAGDDPLRATMAFQFKVGGPFAPIPEPSTYAAIAGVFALVGVVAWRRRITRA
jgi:hypothetical protein